VGLGGRHVDGGVVQSGSHRASDCGRGEKGLHTMFVGDVEDFYLSVTVEMCSIFASRFGSSVGGQFRDVQYHERPILSLDHHLDHQLQIA
jgi:hypothetical protein